MQAQDRLSTVLTKTEDSIGVITLSHGKVNTLSRRLIDDMCAALQQMKSDSLPVVVLRAAPGAKVFSAGHDVRELPTNGRDPLTYSDPLRHVIRELESHPAAIIAMVEGSVWGGACELVMACDLVITACGASFALTPARLGIPYNLSGTLNFLKVAGMHLVKEMLFTAEPMSAERLAAAGVINHVVPRDQLEAFTMDLARRIIQTSPLVHRILKEELRVLGNAHPLNPEAYERIQSLRREVYDSNRLPGRYSRVLRKAQASLPRQMSTATCQMICIQGPRYPDAPSVGDPSSPSGQPRRVANATVYALGAPA